MAPSPKVAESESWAMLPDAGDHHHRQGRPRDQRDRDPSGVAGRRRTARRCLVLPCRPPFGVGAWCRGPQPVVVGGVDVGHEVVVGRRARRAVGLDDEPLVGDRVGGDELRAATRRVPGQQQRLRRADAAVERVADLRGRAAVQRLRHVRPSARARRRRRGRRTRAARRRAASCAPVGRGASTTSTRPAAPTAHEHRDARRSLQPLSVTGHHRNRRTGCHAGACASRQFA